MEKGAGSSAVLAPSQDVASFKLGLLDTNTK